jgi:hypothetical protein
MSSTMGITSGNNNLATKDIKQVTVRIIDEARVETSTLFKFTPRKIKR